MWKRRLLWFLALISLLAVGSTGATNESQTIDYDLFRRQDSISVRLNLAYYLTSRRVEQMKDGIDFAVQYQIVLSRPKRFWGAEHKARLTGLFRIGYRIVTENYSLSGGQISPGDERRFVSLPHLHQFLSDSIIVDVFPLDRLDQRHRYTLKIDLICIALTDLNLAADGDSSDKPRSPLKYLFTQFLRLTGFGREEHTVETRPFSPSEIAPEP